MGRTARVFLGDLRRLTECRAWVREACRDAWGLRTDDDAIARLELALTEAVTNIVRHAYDGQTGRPIELVVEVEDERACVTLHHEGRGFDPGAVPPPDFGGDHQGGFGLYLMRQAVDEVEYLQDDRGRHGVRLVQARRCVPARGEAMLTNVEHIGDVAVVTLNVAQLDAGNADDFREELTPVLADTNRLVLDLGRVNFVDSRGIGAILSCLKQLTARGGDLKLCHVARYVRTTFELVRLHRICEICETREDAIRSFPAPA